MNAILRCSDKKKSNFIAKYAFSKRKDQSKDLRDELMELNEDALEKVAEMHVAIAKYKHTVEIMRWHGYYNLDGRYAQESLVTIR